MAVVVAIAYYGTIASFRVGVDPDTYGVPVVSSVVDFVGAVALIVTISLLGHCVTPHSLEPPLRWMRNRGISGSCSRRPRTPPS